MPAETPFRCSPERPEGLNAYNFDVFCRAFPKGLKLSSPLLLTEYSGILRFFGGGLVHGGRNC